MEQDSEVKADAEAEGPGATDAQAWRLGCRGQPGPTVLGSFAPGPGGWGVGDPAVTRTLRWCGGAGYRVEIGQEGVEPRRLRSQGRKPAVQAGEARGGEQGPRF